MGQTQNIANGISIHVPSWGTTLSVAPVWSLSVFQSTFPRGERLPCSEGNNYCSDFNPRSLVGNDVSGHPFLSIAAAISIHVPSWGTTIFSVCFADRYPYFNPRSLVGNDCKFSQIFFVFLCNKYNFSTFYYPFSLFFSVIHVTFLIFVVRILPAFYVYF